MRRPSYETLCTTALAASLLATGCFDDLKTHDDRDGGASDGGTGTQVDGTVYTTTLDASDEATWVYFDFDTGKQLADAGSAWDIAVNRFKIKTNGGVSGEGGAAVAVLQGGDFGKLAKAPEDGYVEDQDDGADEDSDEDFAFLVNGGWYAYDGSNHTLSPRDLVYVVRSTEARFFKVEMLDYYDGAGTSGFPKFRWAEVEAPGEDIQVGELDAGNSSLDGGAGDADASEATSFGCYDMSAHTCDCTVSESACEGIWTEGCGCANEATADSGTQDASDTVSDANVDVPGCYDPMTHVCACATDEAACGAAGHIWTDGCSC